MRTTGYYDQVINIPSYEQLVNLLSSEWTLYSRFYGHNATIDGFLEWVTARLGITFINDLKFNNLI